MRGQLASSSISFGSIPTASFVMLISTKPLIYAVTGREVISCGLCFDLL